MIVVKTELKEMPKNCSHCPYMMWLRYKGYNGAETCVCEDRVVVSYLDSKIKQNTRPEWCPLVEIKEEEV